MRMEQRLGLARWLAAALRYRTLPLAEWVFASDTSSDTASVRLFGYDCPLEVTRSVTHRLLCVEGERFVRERFLLAGLVQKGDVVVDVGANIGYMGLLFRKCIGPEGQLICIEPDPDNFRELKSCVAANGLGNVVLVEAAVGNEEALVTLKPGLNGHIGDGEGRTVPQMTLDSLDAQRVDFIKIDVEGYEDQVLAGGRTLIARQRPTLFIEMHPYLVARRQTLRAMRDWLRQIYGSLEYFENSDPQGMWAKSSMRYGLTAPVVAIPDEERLFGMIESGERDQPFWAICRSPRKEAR